MRMKASRVTPIRVYKRSVTKDSEGVPVVSWGAGISVTGEHWPAGGQRQIEQYGDRVNNMMNIRIRGDYTIEMADNGFFRYVFDSFSIQEGDGISVYSSEPEFQIVSITPYKPLKMVVEKL